MEKKSKKKVIISMNDVTEKRSRNGNIELLRFIFAVSIVMHHASLPFLRGGWIGVEFFFIVTGYFIAQSTIENHKEETFDQTISESRKNLIKRIKSIYPYFLISCIPAFAVITMAQISAGSSFISAVKRIAYLPYDLFFSQNLGFPVLACIGTLWYLSAMFIAIWIIYPIMRRYGQAFSAYFAPMLNLFLSGFLLQTCGALSTADTYIFGWLNSGIVRAVAMISLGTFVYNISNYIRSSATDKQSKNVYSVIEIISYLVIFLYMLYWKIEFASFDYLIVLLIVLGFSITTSEVSILHGLFDNKVTVFLGKYSMVLFMNHAYWLFNIVSIAKFYGFNMSEETLKIIGIVLSFLTSLIIMLLVDVIKARFQSKIMKTI